MFVPIISSAPHVKNDNVVNKTIVYSDTVLSFNALGKNLRVTAISDVSKNSLESCLNIILKSNPNVIFNTIQYSQNNKKVYFYTNQEISTKAYEDSKIKITKYKPITSSSEIIEEAKNILTAEKNNDNDCVSLFDVAQLLKKINNKYESIKKNYEKKFERIIESNIKEDCMVSIHDLYNKALEISISIDYNVFDKIAFAKENGDLFITESSCKYDKKIFRALSSDLSNLYDELMIFDDYIKNIDSKYGTKAVNSNFGINISRYGVKIYVRISHDFELILPSNKDNYSLKCNSSLVNEAFNGKEEEIFKRIFVKIENCPIWCQQTLYELRQNQLAEDKKLADEKKHQEMKRQKRLALTRKIFPFWKK